MCITLIRNSGNYSFLKSIIWKSLTEKPFTIRPERERHRTSTENVGRKKRNDLADTRDKRITHRALPRHILITVKTTAMNNTYYKYAPNVFLAKCPERHKKGDIINVTTRYGKENESLVFNLIMEKDGFFYYSIVRADGFNIQERAKTKAERYEKWAESAEKKSEQYHEASNEGRDFLIMAEPIKVGHHSEKRHRALIERNWARMGKSVEYADKASEHESKAEYWKRRAADINLSMPESIEYYEHELEEAREYHEGLKSGKYPREHSYSLTYAKKKVNELETKHAMAVRLWG